jgi:HSP20 family protein
MLSRLTGFDPTFDLLDELRRQMDGVWEDFDGRWAGASLAPSSRSLSASTWPPVRVTDEGDALRVEADVPGLGEKDLTLTLHEGVLTIAGKRKLEVPDGYTAQRQERVGLEFSRSFSLPAKVDAEKTRAEVKDGVLAITLAKAAEVRPRQIQVRSQG